MEENKKVVLGMSGGVDSSVAALLLKEQGYEVIGVTMKLYCLDNEERVEKMIEDAKDVCKKLEIEHHVFDFTKEFRDHVISNFIATYKECKTPNPCVECNKFLKFGMMYEKAKELGAYYVATGHYASISYNEKYARYAVKRIESEKDQSYFLYGIPKDMMEHILFPLADYHDKDEIRKIAKDNGLIVASKPDSQDICFVPDGDYIKFLEQKENMKSEEGNIVHVDGTVLGKHNGLYRYTIGQRKGINIAYSKPLYVIGFDKDKNELIVGSEEDLQAEELYATNVNLVLMDRIEDGMRVKTKTRYKKSLEDATLFNAEDRIKVIFDNPILRITPGQSVVFYLDDYVLGGGIIEAK